ncbi:hypothetical protein DPMN_024386 [Dreissena polymorpha]|uniref:Uncharacterized protein n=1 Tax=Dreissena polymorpha TaxID=45954 RepID=A0A9D4LP17_DREPO|nr:hypothetical protein DPMN_024386 [Dreissena polymorpha]
MPAKGEERPKRTNSEVSNDSLNDGSIKQQLESMEQSLKYLTTEMKSILKREEIESLISNTLSSILSEVEKRNEERLTQLKNDIAKEMEAKLQQTVCKQNEEKVKDLTEHIKGLEFENETLKETISSIKNDYSKSIENITTQVNEHAHKCNDAIKRSNYNEQFSRKNNIK